MKNGVNSTEECCQSVPPGAAATARRWVGGPSEMGRSGINTMKNLNMKDRPINSLADYIEAIVWVESQIHKEDFDILHRDYYYRGERKEFPYVISSLYNEKKSVDEIVVYFEGALIEEAKTRFPEIVKECDDNIEMLLKFQHYGLPTRLLDVTQNPLVALFFACNDYDHSDCDDGRVLICTKKITPYSYVRSLGELIGTEGVVTLEQLTRMSLNSKYPIGNTEEHTRRLLANLIAEPLLFRPPQNDSRIKAQLGAFVFTPLMQIISGSVSVDSSDFEVKDNENGNLQNMFEELRIIIPKEKKEFLIDQLDGVGVSEATLFPDYDHKMHYIKNHHLRFKKYDWHLDV